MDILDLPEVPHLVSPLVALCIDTVLRHRLVDDHRLLQANSDTNGHNSLCLGVGTTYSDLPMDIQHQVMERAAELCLLDDFWIGYFIPGINELGALNARGCSLTDAGIELLVGGCPSLLSLDLSFCKFISGSGFARLVDLTELTDLSVESTKITNEAISALSRLTNLRNVNIKGCQKLSYTSVRAFLMALDDIKNFEHDDWQLSPDNMGLEWTSHETTDADLGDDDDFDPEEAYNHMVDMMGRFGAH